MNPMEELQHIIENQKTVTTSRLVDIVERLRKADHKRHMREGALTNTINELNKRAQRAEAKYNKAKVTVENYEFLKRKQANLRKAYNELLERSKERAT